MNSPSKNEANALERCKRIVVESGRILSACVQDHGDCGYCQNRTQAKSLRYLYVKMSEDYRTKCRVARLSSIKAGLGQSDSLPR